MIMKLCVFWDVMLYSPVDITDVSVERTASFFRVGNTSYTLKMKGKVPS
jgi:hypothetical protein